MKLVGESLAALRGERVVFRNVNVELSAGEVLTLHGPNGCGKTTLLRVIAGLLGLMGGRLLLLGDDNKAITDERRDQSIHFIGHQDQIRSQLRVNETLAFHAALLGAPRTSVAPALAEWGLEPLAGHSGGLLSAGQRRRLSLSRLSLQKRSLWLLDEPMTALDATSRERLLTICRAHLGEGGMIIAATHEPFMGDTKMLTLGARS
jgi:heme exporter protein A